jgi:hypothetical protein
VYLQALKAHLVGKGYCQINLVKWVESGMNAYKRHHFPPDIISYAIPTKSKRI